MPQSLKIAVLHRRFCSTGGGAERYAVEMVRALATRHEIHVFAQSFGEPIDGVTYHTIPQWFEKPRYLNQLIYAFFAARLTRRGFDIVHSHENTWVGHVQTIHVLPLRYQLFANKTGIARGLRWLKLITSPRLLTYWWLEKQRLADQPHKKVVVVAPPLKQVLHDVLGCPSHLLATIPPGVGLPPPLSQAEREQLRLQSRLKLVLPMGVKLLLWIGNDANKKGLVTLLQALSWLPDQYHLAIVGSANPREMWVSDLTPSIKDRVHDLGVMQDVSSAYWAADALIHPTREDTFGMVVLEAMAHGLPVAVSVARFCGISAELTHGQQAYLLNDPLDVQEVRRAIGAVTDERRSTELGSRALAWASRYTWANIAKQQEQLYLEIIQNSN